MTKNTILTKTIIFAFCLVAAGCKGKNSTDKEAATNSGAKSTAKTNKTKSDSNSAKKKLKKKKKTGKEGKNRSTPKVKVKWMQFTNKETFIPKWGVKLNLHPKLKTKLKNKTPYIQKKSKWIKHYSEIFNANIPGPDGTNLLNFQLVKIHRPRPNSLSEFSSWWSGEMIGKDRKQGKLFIGMRGKQVRGPGHRSAGRNVHILIPQLAAFTLLPIDDKTQIQCKIKWSAERHSIDSLKSHEFFKKFLKTCLSLQPIKASN